MRVGLLIVSHGKLGDYLLDTATQMLGVCPLDTKTLPVSFDSDPDAVLEKAAGVVAGLDDGSGVLILTDMYGSTPSNIVNRLQERCRVRIVAGVNLPMLIRVLNYPRLSLDELADKALSGGRDGVVLCKSVTSD
ncbi:MAG: PTS sugar transporter subunit IIA [Gammaproteobacteria bacterium]